VNYKIQSRLNNPGSCDADTHAAFAGAPAGALAKAQIDTLSRLLQRVLANIEPMVAQNEANSSL